MSIQNVLKRIDFRFLLLFILQPSPLLPLRPPLLLPLSDWIKILFLIPFIVGLSAHWGLIYLSNRIWLTWAESMDVKPFTGIGWSVPSIFLWNAAKTSLILRTLDMTTERTFFFFPIVLKWNSINSLGLAFLTYVLPMRDHTKRRSIVMQAKILEKPAFFRIFFKYSAQTTCGCAAVCLAADPIFVRSQPVIQTSADILGGLKWVKRR